MNKVIDLTERMGMNLERKEDIPKENLVEKDQHLDNAKHEHVTEEGDA